MMAKDDECCILLDRWPGRSLRDNVVCATLLRLIPLGLQFRFFFMRALFCGVT